MTTPTFPTSSKPRQVPFLLGLFLVTGSMLALEVLDTRLLSVLTWYSLAFLVIAMGLFGLTLGAIRVYLKPEDYEPSCLAASLSRDTQRLAYAIPVSLVGLLIVPLRVESVATTVPLFLVFSALIAVPFYPAGSVVAACLTRSPFPIGRVYAVDLAGAAVGALLVAMLMRALDGPSAILATSAVAALAAICFALAFGDRRSLRNGFIALSVTVVICACNALTTRGLVPLWVKGMPELRDFVEIERWNSHSRVQVLRAARLPAGLWGKGSRCDAPIVMQRHIVIDGHAATPLYLAPLAELGFLDCDVTNVVHRIRPHGSIAIIGVGGSRDIQAAILAGHRPVVGLEFNDRLIEVLKSPLAEASGVARHPDVRLVHEEARSYLTRSKSRYDVIQASLIDTWAATGAGAHALGENGLYTLEAFGLFLERLEPSGVLAVSRWSTVETSRLLALAVGALIERGVRRPREHIALLIAGPVSTLIVARDGLGPKDEQELARAARDKGFVLAVLPSRRSKAVRLEQTLDSTTASELARVTLLPALDFRPPSDDRPFFFNVIRFGAIFEALPEVTKGSIEGNLLATRTLGLSLLASLVLMGTGIVIPLARRAQRTERRAGPALFAALGYFAAIGVGFMFAEIAVLQRLSLVLGHPIYSLMVVLSSLVGGAGLGSLSSDRLGLWQKPWCYLFPVLLSGALALSAFAWPSLVRLIAGADLAARIGFGALLSGTIGLLLGVAFPTGMRLVEQQYARESPWLWAVNGMGSVLASSAAILIALEFGLTVLMGAAAACYLALIPAIVVIRRARS